MFKVGYLQGMQTHMMASVIIFMMIIIVIIIIFYFYACGWHKWQSLCQ